MVITNGMCGARSTVTKLLSFGFCVGDVVRPLAYSRRLLGATSTLHGICKKMCWLPVRTVHPWKRREVWFLLHLALFHTARFGDGERHGSCVWNQRSLGFGSVSFLSGQLCNGQEVRLDLKHESDSGNGYGIRRRQWEWQLASFTAFFACANHLHVSRTEIPHKMCLWRLPLNATKMDL